MGHSLTRLFNCCQTIVGFEAKTDVLSMARPSHGRDCVILRGSDAARAFRPACESHSALLFNHASFDSFSPKPATFHPPKTHPYPALGHWPHNYDLVAARPWSASRRRALFELTLTDFRAPDLEINLTSSPTNQRARASNRKSNACGVPLSCVSPAVRTLYVE